MKALCPDATALKSILSPIARSKAISKDNSLAREGLKITQRTENVWSGFFPGATLTPLCFCLVSTRFPSCFTSWGPRGLVVWVKNSCLQAQAMSRGRSHWAAEAKSVTSTIPGGPAVCGFLATLPAKECIPTSHLSYTFVNFDEDPWTTQSTRVGTRSSSHRAALAPAC